MNVQRTPKQVRKAQNVVHLVWVIAPPGCDNGVAAHFMRLFWRDLGVGVGHCENDRVRPHAFHHFLGDRALDADTQKHIGADHRFFQRAQFSRDRMRRFPLVHALGSALKNHALGVTNDAVLVLCAHPF